MPSFDSEKAFRKEQVKKFWREGEYNVWFSTTSIGVIVLMALTVLYVVVSNGAAALWPRDLALITTHEGQRYLGELIQTEHFGPEKKKLRYQLKIGNRDLYGLDFKWIPDSEIEKIEYPTDAYTLEREEYGNFYGFLVQTQSPALDPSQKGLATLDKASHEAQEKLHVLTKEIKDLAYQMEDLRLKIQAIEYKNAEDPAALPLKAQIETLKEHFEGLVNTQAELAQAALEHLAIFKDATDRQKSIPRGLIHRYFQPNQLGLGGKLAVYGKRLFELFFDEPRESNTEGGLFPAILGTVMLVFMMSFVSFPLGVVAAVYLREYARKGFLVQAIRVAVNNLAGIPSIVWGIFGLAFFVYFVGGGIDALFFPERAPNPVFGTGGMLWASSTLGLLTVPVVIVATEEALGSVPGEIRHGSLALGATQFQTLMRVILPMAGPRIMTGFILAMSRAAGEVAPLMITGVVKLAPTLPVDGRFPFIHLERKFMHLGFHIYDVGFQSPNVEAAKPMVFVTTLLLLGVVVLMTSASIILRSRLKKRYAGRTF